MPLNLPITIEEETLVEDALQVILAVRPGWKREDVKSKVFSGGISNKLLGFFVSEAEEILMIRIYGNNTDVIIDRKAEIDTILALSAASCGPALYATFQNGLCYQHIQGDIVSMEDVRDPEVYPLIIQELLKVHCNIPVGDKRTSQMWDKVRTFNSLIAEILKTNEKVVKGLKSLNLNVSAESFSRAIEEMERLTLSLNMPVTFCHNDLLLGNIIYNKKLQKVSFIDFEYAMSNYPAFDVANHFNEFAGIDNPDFSKCPDKGFRRKWIAEYLKGFKLDGVTLDEDKFELWVDLMLPMSHLFWGLWAIVQAANSTIDFDFVGYFALRYREYEKQMVEIRERVVF